MPRVSAERRDQYMKERREQILDAAIEIFSRKGFDGANVADIATAAGLGKGTVYLYFKSKDEILDSIIEERTLIPQLDSIVVDGDIPLEEELTLIARKLIEFERTHLALTRSMARLLMADAERFPKHAERVYRNVVLKGNQWLAGLLEQQVKAGRIRPLKNPLLTARMLFGMLMVYIWTQDILGGAHFTAISDEQWISEMVDLFMQGVQAGAEPDR